VDTHQPGGVGEHHAEQFGVDVAVLRSPSGGIPVATTSVPELSEGDTAQVPAHVPTDLRRA